LVADVCGVLTESPDAGTYWRKLKQRLGAESSEAVTFCHGLKLAAPDGKQRVTDCANTEGQGSMGKNPFEPRLVLLGDSQIIGKTIALL
jgi:hypothetical protein